MTTDIPNGHNPKLQNILTKQKEYTFPSGAHEAFLKLTTYLDIQQVSKVTRKLK